MNYFYRKEEPGFLSVNCTGFTRLLFLLVNMSLGIQIKIIYTNRTRKRTNPLFISEDEILSDDFQSFKDRIIEVPPLAKTCSPLQLIVSDGKLLENYPNIIQL